jgi:ribosomal protein S18 acetylase RimI-like enzyme
VTIDTGVAVVRDGGDLLARSGADAYLRCEVPPGELDGWAWAGADAFAYVGRDQAGSAPGRVGRLICVGAPAEVEALIPVVLAALPGPPRAFTVPRGCAVPFPDSDTDAWDFRWTARRPPVQPAENRVVDLPAGAEPEVARLLAAASPRPSAEPGDPLIQCWMGVREAHGALVACGALTRRPRTGVANLASIATAPEYRGRGLAAAVTAALTRRVLGGGDALCTLGLYADNEAARRLYTRLGYHDEPGHHFTSGRPAPGRAAPDARCPAHDPG